MSTRFDHTCFACKNLISNRKDRKMRFSITPTSFNCTNFSEVLFCRKHTQNFTTSNLIFSKKQTIVSGISVGTSSNYSFESARFFNYSCHTNSLSNDVFLATDDSLCPIYFNNGVKSECVRAKASCIRVESSYSRVESSYSRVESSYSRVESSYSRVES